ncbi:hypothetical protein MKW94_010019 [Papaver nudicaule]|uniref:Peroxidase n=1 Tax=Papaver nudicaule TaxID=74823 RepID=A0AA41RZK2_PAPNU|nr:hypothetical protein [Papaver nudicaule]
MKTHTNFLLFATLLVVVLIGTLDFQVCSGALHETSLNLKFYKQTCPKAEKIIKAAVDEHAKTNPFLGALLLRIHYHDCFVRGCDASLLLDPSSKTKQVEKQARPNLSVLGFDVIDDIKTQVEKACPHTVSCADIIALATRDAVSFQFRRPMWKVPLGRRDGRDSLATDVIPNLPSASSNFSTLLQLFSGKGLNLKDLVALSGAHTVGIAHCGEISRRLFNFSGKGDTDPSLNPAYAKSLKAQCANINNIVEMDPTSVTNFDNHYYRNLLENKGLFNSDASLLTDKSAAKLVNHFQVGDKFLLEFAKSMRKMGAMDVLTGKQGEIRKKCHLRN